MKTIIKALIVTVLMVCIAAIGSLNAQNISYGIKAGADFSNWGGKDVEDMDLDINPGFHIGGFFETPLAGMLNLESGLYLSTKGFRAEETFEGLDLKLTSTSYYLDLPVLAKYSFANNLNIFAGPQFSYLLNNKYTVKVSGEKETDWDTEGLSRFDTGMVAGAGYKFGNGFGVSANYDLGLLKLGKDDNTKVYNRVAKLSIGYSF